MNVKLELQYDGSRYHGWQVQKNAMTVQETVTRAIEKITGEAVSLTGCGRTDAGVHADMYVCNFHTGASVPADKYPYALNSVLPDDIVCIRGESVADDFHSNRSAVAKRYIYTILNSEFPNAFLKNYAWHCRYPLDIDKMRRAALPFVGEHDFVGFASSGFSVKTTVREIYALDVSKNGDIITIDVTGNGFLYNMVRIIAGTLVYAGSGRIDPARMTDIIASRDRKNAGITAPAQGLCLKEVYYTWERMTRSAVK